MSDAKRLSTVTIILVTALLIIAACTRTPESVAQVPTLAALPSDTHDPALPSPTATRVPTITLSPVPTPPPTPTATPRPACDMEAWWISVEPLVTRFFDTVDVAGATPRSSLSSVLLEMRQVFRDFERAEFPECATEARREIVAGMEKIADGFNEFLGDLEFSSSISLEIAYLHLWAAERILVENNISADQRLLDMSFLSGYPNAASATWVSEVGEFSLHDKAWTGTWSVLNTRSAVMDMTLTEIFRP